MPADNPSLPELMSPAGDWDCARAAVENGADAVYFGLDSGLNARARATNFSRDDLPRLMTFLRTRGVRGYLALNTLVFDDELEQAEDTARCAVAAGVDAVLVQDLGAARLLQRLCPDLPLHASTQMTLSSDECIAEASSLGIRRVVLPRELSIEQIAAIRKKTSLELEVFIHGALCISYSGQCLASLSLGGRSANRGQCAQPCRLPYDVLNAINSPQKFPLSPHDLAAYERLADLIGVGVTALKIEGRLKPAEYVAGTTRFYRRILNIASTGENACAAGFARVGWGTADVSELETLFSRGFCRGWLDGPDPQSLVSGQTSTNRGAFLGVVRRIGGERIAVDLAGPVRRGDGVAFENGRDPALVQGGRVYEIFQNRRPVEAIDKPGEAELAFGRDAVNMSEIYVGQKVWKTDDPHVARRLRESYSSEYSIRRVPLDVTVQAAVGKTLKVAVRAATNISCSVESPEPLAEAHKHPISAETLTEQFGRLGKTPYQLRRLQADIVGRPMVPLSVLGKLRREMIELLNAAAARPDTRRVADESALKAILAETAKYENSQPTTSERADSAARLHVLCRSVGQIEAAIASGASSIIADFQDLNELAAAMRIARAAGAIISLATPRIHKPGESFVFQRLAEFQPDVVLVRNLAGLAFFRTAGIPVTADFSLNAVNELAVRWLLDRGAERVAAGYDLTGRRLLDLAQNVAQRLEVVVHRHTPMFHTEYCVFCASLSQGKNIRDCGRPCRAAPIRLRDRLGVEHLLTADSLCRNTLFHAKADSCADLVAQFIQRGVRHFRVELLTEKTLADVEQTLATLRPLFA